MKQPFDHPSVGVRSKQGQASLAAFALAALFLSGPSTMPAAPIDPPTQQLSGIVLDPQGRVVSGARIRVLGRQLLSTNLWTASRDGDELARSDATGRFRFPLENGVITFHATVEAQGYAPAWVSLARDKDAVVLVHEGVTVRGRVVRSGKGVEGVELVAESQSVAPRPTLGGFAARTDRDGRFALHHLPINTRCALSSPATALRSGLLVGVRMVETRGNGVTVDAGDLPLMPPPRMTGRVELRAGLAVPIPGAGTVRLIRERFREEFTTPLNADGSFEFPIAPMEVLKLRVELPGYRLSGQNRSLDPEDPGQLIGFWNGDVYPVKILIEPGEPLKASQLRVRAKDESPPREEILKGID